MRKTDVFCQWMSPAAAKKQQWSNSYHCHGAKNNISLIVINPVQTMATYKMKQDQNGDYFWILKSDKNGKTVAMSSESYESKQGAKDSIEWTRANAKGAGYDDIS